MHLGKKKLSKVNFIATNDVSELGSTQIFSNVWEYFNLKMLKNEKNGIHVKFYGIFKKKSQMYKCKFQISFTEFILTVNYCLSHDLHMFDIFFSKN